MLKAVRRFRIAEDGTTAIEYGLLAALIATAIVGGISQLSTSLDALYNKIGAAFSF